MNPAVDDMITMVPAPLAISLGSSAWVTCSVPRTLTSYMACQSAGSLAATVSAPNAPPALLTSTSQRSTALANCCTAARSVTSSTVASAWPPSPRSWPASSSIRLARRAARITRYPARASLVAVAAPIPLLAPVTTATGCIRPPFPALLRGQPNRRAVAGGYPSGPVPARPGRQSQLAHRLHPVLQVRGVRRFADPGLLEGREPAAQVLEQPLARAEQDRREVQIQLADQPRGQELLDDAGPAADRNVLAACGLLSLGQRVVDAAGDKCVAGLARHPVWVRAAGHHEHRPVERGRVTPAVYHVVHPAADDDRARGAERLVQHLAVDAFGLERRATRIRPSPAHDPVVQPLAAFPEPPALAVA